ncbi:protein BatD [Mariprofundus erugo]|uniref:Protein BatD n=1 Tax=Mariprofundus erugo TaxID=2528639 RepID=A0A5R9GSK7_9PROT|nr:BatD family protein [Mariprofundus erugo]TLS67919.1 protein BatD [Mariprofundus erugo]
MVKCFGHKQLRCIWLIAAMLLWASSAMATVTASVDRHTIAEDETVNLTIETSGSQSGEPDTSVLEKDFELLSRNHSSSYTITNGSMHSSSNWQLVLRPRTSGTLVIPPIAVGHEKTAAVTIEVTKAEVRQGAGGQPDGDVWVEMSLKPDHALVQQQVIVTIRVYQGVALAQAQLTEPEVKDAVIERLGEDRQYQQNRNGRSWEVTERKYALFPQQSGKIEIAPVELDAVTMAGAGGGGFSPFFQSTRPLQAHSNHLVVQVDPVPASWHGKEWLPATHVTLTEDWPEGKVFKTGEPITRTLTVKAEGLASSQLPALPSLLPDHLKAYPDQPALSDDKGEDGIVGMRREKVAMMPTQPGTYMLPEIELDWWNVATGKVEHATLPPRTFRVEGAVAAAPAMTPQLPGSSQPAETATAAPVQRVVSDAGWWRPVAIISTIGWLLTLLWMVFRRRRPHLGQTMVKQQSPDVRAARRAVIDACRNNDARGSEQALLQFAAASWPDEAGAAMAALMKRCDEPLSGQIGQLQQHLYGRDQGHWQGHELLHAFEQHDFARVTAAPEKELLPGLYPR